jgi:hypothetical protein
MFRYSPRSILCVVALFAASGVTTSLRAGDSVNLTPKHKAGQTSFIEVDRNIEQEISVGGGDDDDDGGGQKLKLDIHQVYGAFRTAESAEKYTLTFDRMLQSVESPMMKGQFDTDDPDADKANEMLGAVLTPFIGMSLTLNLENGEVASASGMKKIADKVKEAGANPFTQIVQRELTDDSAKVTWGDYMFILYPNKEVKVGDTWKKSLTTKRPDMGTMLIDYTCKLDRITEEKGRKMAVVSFETTSKLKSTGKATSKPTNKIDGHSKGTALFDIEHGEFVERSEKGSTKLDLTSPRPMKINASMSSKMTVLDKSVRDSAKAEMKKKAATKSKEKAKKKAKEELDEE